MLYPIRGDGKIKHCRIKQEGRLFIIGNATFETLIDLVNYYKNHPLYRNMKLKYAATDRLLRELGTVSSDPFQFCNVKSDEIKSKGNKLIIWVS